MKNNILSFLFIFLFATACTNNEVYLQYQSIPSEGWNKDSLCVFDIQIPDSSANYNVYVNIRNRGEYPYQNLWLFLNVISPDSLVMNDSIECYLADQRGKWLGTGVGAIVEMPVLYQQNIRFEQKGTYRYEIEHGMREDMLIGINDIGIRIEKVTAP